MKNKRKNKNPKRYFINSKINKEGFTLVELIAVIAILSLLVGLSAVAFINIRKTTLEKQFANLISYIETKAANYADDTGITTISVEDLIKAGYLEPDDETDIYNPLTNESINCYIIRIDFKDGEYIPTFDRDNKYVNAEGTCKDYEQTGLYQICAFGDDGTCKVENIKPWSKDLVKLGVIKNNEEFMPETTYSWTSTDGNTGSDPTIEVKGVEGTASRVMYTVKVTEGTNKTGEARVKVGMDRQNPIITEIKVEDEARWTGSKKVEVIASDYAGSGIKNIYKRKINPGDNPTCNNLSDYESVTNNKFEIEENGTFHICVDDQVGNISAEGKSITVDRIDETKPTATLTVEPTPITGTEYTNKVKLIGTGKDNESGLKEYAFSSNSNLSSSSSEWKDLSSVTLDEITKDITYDKNNRISSGEQTYYFYVKDVAGNIARSNEGKFKIDLEAPYISYFTYNISSSGITLRANVQDVHSGIKKYAFTKSSSEPTSWTTLGSPVTTNQNYTTTVSGLGTYYFWVEDAIGNKTYDYVNVSKMTPYLSIAQRYVTIYSTENSKTISYTYDGDGVVSCSPTRGSYASCSVNQANKTVTFSRIDTGEEEFILSASEGTLYEASSRAYIEVTVEGKSFTNNSQDVTGVYNGSPKTFAASLSPTPTGIYYSTSRLTQSNFKTSGSTSRQSRTEVGTTTVYWCAYKTGYETYCSSNTITVTEATLTNRSSDVEGTYTGNNYTFTANVSPTATIYYSTSSLTSSNYTYRGSTTPISRSSIGTTRVYWCAVKANYATLCSSNTITVKEAPPLPTFSNSSRDVTATFNGSAHRFTASVSPTATIYYSTTTRLNTSNYTSGTTTAPSRVNVGTDTVYWCAYKAGYQTYCSTNYITVNKATPSLNPTSVSLGTGTSASITYTGDGTPKCNKSVGTYTNCSVSGKTITFSRSDTSTEGSEYFTITATGTNYENLSQTVSVSVSKNTTVSEVAKCMNEYTRRDCGNRTWLVPHFWRGNNWRYKCEEDIYGDGWRTYEVSAGCNHFGPILLFETNESCYTGGNVEVNSPADYNSHQLYCNGRWI